MSALEKVKELAALKKSKDELEEALKAVNAKITTLAVNEIPKLFEDGEIEKIAVEGIGTCFITTKVEAYVLKENESEFHKWLKRNRHGALIKPYVFPSTLKSFAKEQLEQNRPLPEILKVTLIPTATIRKGK
jgi:hypothetical protein